MKKKLRTILVWTLVSFLLQYGAYSFLNNKVHNIMAPPVNSQRTLQLKATIPGSDLKNIQISYAMEFLAYTENGTLKVFNLKNEKVVFEKKSPVPNDKTLGVLTYQWLPDSNILIYFYAKKNPNPVTYVIDYTAKTSVQDTKQTPTPTPVQPKKEDPNEEKVKEVPKATPKEVPVAPKVKNVYGNPQITELYRLSLPHSDEDTPPDDHLDQTITDFPADGKIKDLVFSTLTNLVYLNVKNSSTELIMEISVMKRTRNLNKSGESINDIAVSDRYGTLFIDSKVGNTRQIVALVGTKRQIISKNTNDRILGIRAGKVYIGEIENNELIKINTTSDRAEWTNTPSLKTEWKGSIPFDSDMRMLIGAKGQMIVYNHQSAYIVKDGKLEEAELQGDENYINVDGVELIQLTKEGTSTLVELQSLGA